MRFILLIISIVVSIQESKSTRFKAANLITCFQCTGQACHQPFNLSESGISSSLCVEGCVMQQIITIVENKKQLVTTIRGCITNEGCETTTRNSIMYENSCCYHNLCNSFFTTTTKSTTSPTTTLPTESNLNTNNSKRLFNQLNQKSFFSNRTSSTRFDFKKLTPFLLILLLKFFYSLI